MESKICCTCGEVRELDSFAKDRTKKDGRHSKCKACAKVYSREYYLKNSTVINKRVKGYRVSYIPKHHRDIFSKLKNICTCARQRKHKGFDIVPEDLYKLWNDQKGKCSLTGMPLTPLTHQPNTVSLDRIDSKIGYLVGNLQLTCWYVNYMKQDLSEDVFIQFCHMIANNNRIIDTPVESMAQYNLVDQLDYTCTLDNTAP